MNVVLRFSPGRSEDLRAFLHKAGFSFESRPHTLFFATRPGVSLSAYASGKLLVTGAQAEEYAGVLQGAGMAEGEPRPKVQPVFGPHAGGDESGKGDYFGPLSTACVFIPDKATAEALVSKGVRDSKDITNAEIGPLASLIRARCPHTTVVLMPERYNEIYHQTPNLNDILAWAHARCIEDLREKEGPVPVVIDQFARPEVLERHLMQRGRDAAVSQMVRAESDVAVAAASIVARAEFLAGIAALETRIGARLPLGAGQPVVRAARELAARHGRDVLWTVAKTHFATTKAALGR